MSKIQPGQIHHHLRVIDYPFRVHETSKNYKVLTECTLCGSETIIWTSNLGRDTHSCGCLKRSLYKNIVHDELGRFDKGREIDTEREES